jgi:MFS family permease
MSTIKSIGAVLAGMITIVALSTGTDWLLERLGIFPPPEQGLFIVWMLLLALVYRSIYAVAGGYVTAMLAPDRPMRHAIILGIIGIVASIAGTIVGWDLSAHWYPILLIITSLPCTWLGGKLKTKTAA